MASGTVIGPCNCESKYQNLKYGKGQRVFNVGTKNATCTVCGTKR